LFCFSVASVWVEPTRADDPLALEDAEGNPVPINTPAIKLEATAAHIVMKTPTPTDAELKSRLIIWADAEPDGGDAPLTVKFRCDPLGETAITSYEWDFGDGSPKVKEESPSHTDEKPGSYTARLVVGDAKGSKGEDETVIDVEAP
jgi:PKD repeat protein